MKYKCSRCGSIRVLRELSFMADPNDNWEDIMTKASSSIEWNDFDWCLECDDSTILEEDKERG